MEPAKPPYKPEDLLREDAVRGRAIREGLAYWYQRERHCARHLQEVLAVIESLAGREHEGIDIQMRLKEKRVTRDEWHKEFQEAIERLAELTELARSAWE